MSTSSSSAREPLVEGSNPSGDVKSTSMRKVVVLLVLLLLIAVAGLVVMSKQDQPDPCEGIDLATACARVMGDGGAGARRRLTGKDLKDTCLPHHRITFRHSYFPVHADLTEPRTFPYHASHDLTVGGNYSMALIVLHGAIRDADSYFCMMNSLVKIQDYRKPSDVLIITPDFNYANDKGVIASDLFWNASKPWGDWRGGAHSDPRSSGADKITFSAYEVLDMFVRVLDSDWLYPNLNEVAFVGHSAGGQTVQRYALVTEMASVVRGGLDIRYVVANPSSYVYLDNKRWAYSCQAGPCNCTAASCRCDATMGCSSPHQLGVPSQEQAGKEFVCWGGYRDNYNFNNWPYGLGDGLLPYAPPYVKVRDLSDAIQKFPSRHIDYLVGQNDTCNDQMVGHCDTECWQKDNGCFRNQMDTRCPAMLQGRFRKERGHKYMEYLKQYFGKPVHSLMDVPGCGHNATCMFYSGVGVSTIFQQQL